MQNLFIKIKRRIKLGKGRRKKKVTGVSFFKVKKKVKKGGSRKADLKNVIILLLFIGFFMFLFIWCCFCMYRLISIKFSKAYKDESVGNNEEWSGDGRINILLVGMDTREGEFGFADALTVIMIDPYEHSIGIFNINPDISIYLPKQKKYVKFRNLYNIGVIDSDEVPIRSLIHEIEMLLSIKINRYIMVDEERLVNLTEVLGGIYVNNVSAIEDSDILVNGGDFKLESGNYRLNGEDFLNYLKADDDGVENKFIRQINGLEGFLKRSVSYITLIKLPAFLDELSSGVYTDFSKQEFIYLAYEIIRFKDIRSAFIRMSSLKEREGIDDVNYLPIYEELDQDIQKVFIDSRVGKEQARVEIFNSTNIKGLAAFRARWLKNIGIDVIRVGDSSYVFERTTIFTREKGKYLDTIDAVKNSFNEDIEIKEGEMPSWVCTGDVIVVLGGIE